MIGLNAVYWLAGIMFAGFALRTLVQRRDARRIATASFWALLATSFLLGDRLGDVGNGVLVVAIVLVGASGRTGPAPRDETAADAAAGGNRLFVPALMIPIVALGGTFLFKQMPDIVVAKDATIVALALGALLSALLCVAWFRLPAHAPFAEGVRLMAGVGWAVVMPQLLASLGTIYTAAGMGETVGALFGYVPTGGSLFVQVALYGAGMAMLTILMGNAFAAFPVMFAAVGAPILIAGQGGTPAAVAAIGMLAGFCGTLMTPMAANFNLVPAALLDLPDRYGVIRAQVPTAVAMLAVNVVLLYLLGFR